MASAPGAHLGPRDVGARPDLSSSVADLGEEQTMQDAVRAVLIAAEPR